MHKIFDLREMDIERLHALAGELGIKGFKKMDKDALVYSILDEEAKKNALTAPERPEKPRRNKNRKDNKQTAKPAEDAEKPQVKPVAAGPVVEKEEAFVNTKKEKAEN